MKPDSAPQTPEPFIQEYFTNFHRILGIYVTNKCNATCEHCCTGSSPFETSRFSVDDLIDGLQSIGKAGWVRALHVSGGEPFLVPDILKKIGTIASKHSLLYAINTNGYWASSELKARKKISSIPGLTQISLSTDIYHEPEIPISRIINAAIAGLDFGLKVQLGVCVPGGQRNDYVVSLEQRIGEDLLSKLELVISPLEADGRAAKLPEANWRQMDAERPRGYCQQINRPVVLEDGRFVACCNTPITSNQPDHSPLILGSLKRQSISTLNKKAEKDPIVQAIRVLGPDYLAGVIDDLGLTSELTGPYRRDNICDLCTEIVTNKILVRALYQSLLSDTAIRDLAVAKAAKFDDLEMLFELSQKT
jgi:hypothetical protein